MVHLDLEEKFDDAIGQSSLMLWERTGRNYVAKEGEVPVSDICGSRNTAGYPTLVRETARGKEVLYAEWDVSGKTMKEDGETTIRVYNADAEEIIYGQMMRAGFIKRPLPPGVTLEELGHDAEFYDDGLPGKVLIERAYDDSEWNAHRAAIQEKIDFARRMGGRSTS